LTLPSLVWGRDPQEAFEEPYEYGIQEQFAREAETLFLSLYRLLNSDVHSYSLSDTTREKAVWLLAMDALDALRDCLRALVRKDHRVAGRLFRDVVETMDLAKLFHTPGEKSERLLKKWYANEVVPHREYRDLVKRTRGPKEAQQLSRHYASLSKFTHRSYRAILDGYLRGSGDRLVHDGRGELGSGREESARLLVLPQTISYYYAVLANLALVYANDLTELGLATGEQIRDVFAQSLETETIPRRFMPRRWLIEKMKKDATERGQRG